MTSYIDAINQAANVTATSTQQNTDDSVMGKEDFLTLLVAQLENQDPLNPDEPTEFTAQLAQFSSLEQLFTLNDSMENLVTATQSSEKVSTLSTIGKDVAFQSSSFTFDGSPVEIGYQLDSPASEVSLIIQQNGSTVATLEGSELSSGTHYLTWDGSTLGESAATSGDYTMIIQAKASADSTVGAIPVVKAEVTGVDLSGENGGTLITVSGEVSFNSVLGVYEPKVQTTPGNVVQEEDSESESFSGTVETIAQVTDDAKKLID